MKINILDAISILGEDRVVKSSSILDAKEVIERRESLLSSPDYTREQLEAAADANNKGLANWFLIYHYGKSPKEILDERFENLEFGFGEKNRFDKNHWFSHSNESFWVEKKEKAGYYLLNFFGEEDEFRKMRFESLSFHEQEERIKLLPTKMRAPFNIVMESVFSIHDILGILLLRDWNHLSDTRIHDGRLLYLGGTASKASGEKIMNIFGFPKEQEEDRSRFYGFGAVLMMKK